MDAILRGLDGDATNEEKIRTTVMEKEKERVMQRTVVAHGGAGAKTTTMKAAVEATTVAGRVDTGAASTATVEAIVK